MNGHWALCEVSVIERRHTWRVGQSCCMHAAAQRSVGRDHQLPRIYFAFKTVRNAFNFIIARKHVTQSCQTSQGWTHSGHMTQIGSAIFIWRLWFLFTFHYGIDWIYIFDVVDVSKTIWKWNSDDNAPRINRLILKENFEIAFQNLLENVASKLRFFVSE